MLISKNYIVKLTLYFYSTSLKSPSGGVSDLENFAVTVTSFSQAYNPSISIDPDEINQTKLQTTLNAALDMLIRETSDRVSISKSF